MNWPKLAVLAAGLAALSGCSMMRVGWRLGPWLAEREAQKFLQLPAKDRPRLEKEIEALMGSFSAEGAPAMARTAGEMADLIEREELEAAWDLGSRELKRHWEKGTGLAVASFAPLMATSDPKRQQAMLAEMERRDAKDFKFYEGKTPEQLALAGAKRTRDWMEKWLVDELSPEQFQALLKFQTEHPTPWRLWKAGRERNRAAFLEAQKGGEAAMRQMLETWWLRPERRRSPEEQQVLKAHQDASLALAKALYLGFSPAQRASLVRRLRSLAGDLEWIAARGQPPKA